MNLTSPAKISWVLSLALTACGSDAELKCVSSCETAADAGAGEGNSGEGGEGADSGAAGAPKPGAEDGPVLDRWRSGPDLPGTPAAFAGVVAVEGKLFVVGGRTLNQGANSGEPVLTVQAYDPNTQRWTLHESLPEGLVEPNIGASGRQIYVLGAKGDTRQYRYDVALRQWEQIGERPVPVGLGGSAVAEHAGVIYVAGGLIPSPTNERGARQKTFSVYNTKSGKWTNLPDAPVENAFHGAAVVDGVLYTFGGSTETGEVARRGQTFGYDLKTEEWTERALMPLPVSSQGTAAVGRRVYLVGGITGVTGRINPEVQIFDTQANEWVIGEPMPTPRFAMGAAAIDGEVYVPAGVRQVSETEFAAVPTLEILGR
ncbi:MAG: hypothetical protein RJA70_628 [Pseudomonadota bacterium]|jgi:N-acetylneuraminic acid mutarotase